MKRIVCFIMFQIIAIVSLLAGGEHGRIADVASVQVQTDNNFITSYRVCFRNNTSKTITSFEVSYWFKSPYTGFDIANNESFVKIHPIVVAPGQTGTTGNFEISPNNHSYIMYGVYIKAVRFSDGSVIRRSSNQGSYEQSFGDYYL